MGDNEKGKLIKSKFMYEEWEFTTRKELDNAARKEARVCGDVIRDNSDGGLEIYNHHAGAVRWVGKEEEDEG